ncbi:MAG: sigma-70 family RNA polymerase sigma factor [Planctomycetota bacterium]
MATSRILAPAAKPLKRPGGFGCLPCVMNATTQINPEALLSHLDFVRGVARSLLFDEHEVDDVVQQTWLQAVRRPPRKPGALRSWLGTVARNLARNARRDQGRRGGRQPAQPEPDMEPAVSVPSTADVVEREAVRRQVVKAVLALREPYRGTVLLRYFEGLSPAQIAAQLKVPGATVRTRLRRGLEQLRTMLDSAHGGDRRAWCLQLIPLAAFAPDPLPLWVPTGSKTTWITTAAAATLLTGVAVTWSVMQNPGEQDPGAAETVAAGENSRPLSAARRPAVTGEAPSREVVATATDHPSVQRAMVGFRGRLFTPGGEPARGRIVQLAAFEPNRLFLDGCDPLASSPRAPHVGRATARTGADGSFLLSGLWPRGTYLLWTDTAKADFLCRVVARSPRPGEVTDLGDLHLLEGVEITGRVEDQDGEPIEGALVWSCDLNGAVLKTLMFDQVDTRGGLIVHGAGGPRVHLFPGWFCTFGDFLGLPSTRTGADGSFRLTGLTKGQCMLVAHANGHEPYMRQRLRLRPGKAKDLGTIRLRGGEELQGEVVDANSRPVRGAEVVVAPTGVATQTDLFGSVVPIDFARRPCTTDARGRFQVAGLPKGKVTVAVRRRPGDPWLVRGPIAAADELRCKLPAPVTLRVSLKSTASGRPVPEFKLVQGEVRGEVLLGSLYRPVEVGRRLSQGQDGDHVIRDLLPGTYTLITRADGYAMTVDTFELRSDLLLHVTLKAATTMRVRVTDQRGQPVVAANVLARMDAAPEWSRSILLARTMIPGWRFVPENCGETDADGMLTVRRLPAGTVNLTVSHPAYGSVTKTKTLPHGQIGVVLEDPGGIKGRFLDGDMPASRGKWILAVQRESGVDDKGPTRMRQLIEQGRDGSFEVQGLAPGDYDVEPVPTPRAVHSPNTLKDYVESEHFGFFVSRPSVKVTVHAGRTAQVTVNARPNYAGGGDAGGRISGTFLINGQPGEGCSVMYSDAHDWFAKPQDNKQARAVVDAAGRFDLGRLRAGEYKVAAFDPRGAKIWSRRVNVAAGAAEVIEVSLTVGVLQGIVLDPGGTPVTNAAVRVTQTKKREVIALHRTTTGADGRFLVAGMPTGDYAIYVVADKVGEAWARGYRVTAGTTGVSRTVQLMAYVEVRGKVDMKSFGIEGAEHPVVVFEAIGSWHQQKLAPDGAFVFPKVLPGEYSVRVAAALGPKGLWVQGDGAPVEVGKQGASDLKITKQD